MWFCALLVVAFVLPMVLYIVISNHKSHATYGGNVRNHDPLMREFCYEVPKSPEEICSVLERRNGYDTLDYRYDPEKNRISFFYNLSSVPEAVYDLQMRRTEKGTMLKIIQQGKKWEQNRIALLQNEFWHKKAEAVPVPYEAEEE